MARSGSLTHCPVQRGRRGGAREGNRTPDLLITSELLCRLSYPGGAATGTAPRTPTGSGTGAAAPSAALRYRDVREAAQTSGSRSRSDCRSSVSFGLRMSASAAPSMAPHGADDGTGVRALTVGRARRGSAPASVGEAEAQLVGPVAAAPRAGAGRRAPAAGAPLAVLLHPLLERRRPRPPARASSGAAAVVDARRAARRRSPPPPRPVPSSRSGTSHHASRPRPSAGSATQQAGPLEVADATPPRRPRPASRSTPSATSTSATTSTGSGGTSMRHAPRRDRDELGRHARRPARRTPWTPAAPRSSSAASGPADRPGASRRGRAPAAAPPSALPNASRHDLACGSSSAAIAAPSGSPAQHVGVLAGQRQPAVAARRRSRRRAHTSAAANAVAAARAPAPGGPTQQVGVHRAGAHRGPQLGRRRRRGPARCPRSSSRHVDDASDSRDQHGRLDLVDRARRRRPRPTGRSAAASARKPVAHPAVELVAGRLHPVVRPRRAAPPATSGGHVEQHDEVGLEPAGRERRQRRAPRRAAGRGRSPGRRATSR